MKEKFNDVTIKNILHQSLFIFIFFVRSFFLLPFLLLVGKLCFYQLHYQWKKTKIEKKRKKLHGGYFIIVSLATNSCSWQCWLHCKWEYHGVSKAKTLAFWSVRHVGLGISISEINLFNDLNYFWNLFQIHWLLIRKRIKKDEPSSKS